MTSLSQRPLIKPAREAEPLSETQARELQQQIPGWETLHEVDANKLRRQYKVRNFAQALQLTNRIGELAEQENHHPTLVTEWGKVTVIWWTHWLAGLHENDYIMAARTDELYQELTQ